MTTGHGSAGQTQPRAAQPDGARPTATQRIPTLQAQEQHVASGHPTRAGACTPWLTCLLLLLSFIAMSPQSLLSTWTQACPLCPGSHDHGDNTRGDQHVLGLALAHSEEPSPERRIHWSSDAPFDRGLENRISGLSHIIRALSTRQSLLTPEPNVFKYSGWAHRLHESELQFSSPVLKEVRPQKEEIVNQGL